MPKLKEKSGTNGVSLSRKDEFPLEKARAAYKFALSSLERGPGNKSGYILEDEGLKYKLPTDVEDNYKNATEEQLTQVQTQINAGINAKIDKSHGGMFDNSNIITRALESIHVKTGNCDQHAFVVFYHLVKIQNLRRDAVRICQSDEINHTFVTIETSEPDVFIICDPWAGVIGTARVKKLKEKPRTFYVVEGEHDLDVPLSNQKLTDQHIFGDKHTLSDEKIPRNEIKKYAFYSEFEEADIETKTSTSKILNRKRERFSNIEREGSLDGKRKNYLDKVVEDQVRTLGHGYEADDCFYEERYGKKIDLGQDKRLIYNINRPNNILHENPSILNNSTYNLRPRGPTRGTQG